MPLFEGRLPERQVQRSLLTTKIILRIFARVQRPREPFPLTSIYVVVSRYNEQAVLFQSDRSDQVIEETTRSGIFPLLAGKRYVATCKDYVRAAIPADQVWHRCDQRPEYYVSIVAIFVFDVEIRNVEPPNTGIAVETRHVFPRLHTIALQVRQTPLDL
jgi:hypothetical protein